MNLVYESKVELLGSYGNDYTVIDAARTSTGKTKKQRAEEADKKLLKHLYTNKHMSPFEQVSFQFHITTPIFVVRQLFRHRTLKPNEASARFKEMPMDFFMPPKWRGQATSGNKQGSSPDAIDQSGLSVIARHAYAAAEAAYLSLLDRGVAKELARSVLPVSLMTELVISVDLRNLMHLLELRLDSHAQPEIQDVARLMLEAIKPIVPWTMEIFQEGGKNV